MIFITARCHAWRGLCCRKMSVRPSIRPSVTCRYSIETTIHIIKLFLPAG